MFEFLEKYIKRNDIGEPPYDYNFLLNLDSKKYPLYLEKIFYCETQRKLNLTRPKTFNEKIQWLKLYDCTPLKTKLTDKVLVRDWIKEKIGEEYLKPVLWIGKSFDEIPFEQLPKQFIIKANHGSKWNYRIKDKERFLSKGELFLMVRNNFNSWLSVSFFPWAGFELQYKDIEPRLIIEPLLLEKGTPVEYEIYCFNGEPQIYQKVRYSLPIESCVYEKDFSISHIAFNPTYKKNIEIADNLLKKAVKLSKILAKDFKLVRVDWLVNNDKLYFNEMTFTPFSGFYKFSSESQNLRLGKMLNLSK